MVAQDTNVMKLVKIGFAVQGTTFTGWCRKEGLHVGYAHDVATGKTNGPKARALRARIIAAASNAA